MFIDVECVHRICRRLLVRVLACLPLMIEFHLPAIYSHLRCIHGSYSATTTTVSDMARRCSSQTPTSPPPPARRASSVPTKSRALWADELGGDEVESILLDLHSSCRALRELDLQAAADPQHARRP